MRTMELPGYWGFTREIVTLLWSNRKPFIFLSLVYCLLTALFVGLSSQSTYNELSELLTSTGAEIFSGGIGEVGRASLLLVSSFTGAFSPQLTDVQQVYGALLFLMLWLTTVWLLRSILAGNRPVFRDGLYSAGAPIVSTAIVFLVLIIQLIPLLVAILVMSAAVSSGFISSGLLSMLLWLVVGLIGMISLYWMTSTFFAMVIVTLPGMYPWQALRSAGDLVIGRRLRLLLRIIWALILTGVGLTVALLPLILIDAALRDVWQWFENVPLVPIVFLLSSAIAATFLSGYIYLLYRKAVEDDASPA
jgi:hypothetical protein